MSDPNMADFYSRVARIQRDHSRGYGMEADGTLGASFYHRIGRSKSKAKMPILAPILMVVCCAFTLKAVLHARIGDDLYAQRVAELQAGEEFDRIGATLMAADPITLMLSEQISKLGL